MSQTVRILVAAYNGEAYLCPLLDSLLAQEDDDFEIIVSDDHSDDHTRSILLSYAERYPDLIRFHQNDRRFGCAQLHFYHLMEVYQDVPYLMFCDQDDIWHPDKIRLCRQAMAALESNRIPVLVHTDLRVVDQSLNEIAPSFLHFSGLDGHRTSLASLLVQNVVTGCTVMINHALAKLCCSSAPSPAMRMHDWWLALLAAACGRIGFVDQATIDYRQHGNNAVGAKNARSLSYLIGRLRQNNIRASFFETTAQAASLLDAYGAMMPERERTICATFAALPQLPKLKRLKICRTYHFFKQSLPRKIGQLLWW